MAAKRAHHPMHIKRRTRGSSNEISFSVLDAAREARDAEERDRREGGSGGPSLFTLGKGKSLGQHRSKGSPSSCLAKLPHPRQPLLPLLIEK